MPTLSSFGNKSLLQTCRVQMCFYINSHLFLSVSQRHVTSYKSTSGILAHPSALFWSLDVLFNTLRKLKKHYSVSGTSTCFQGEFGFSVGRCSCLDAHQKFFYFYSAFKRAIIFLLLPNGSNNPEEQNISGTQRQIQCQQSLLTECIEIGGGQCGADLIDPCDGGWQCSDGVRHVL